MGQPLSKQLYVIINKVQVQVQVVSGYAQKFKMAEPSDNSCSSLSEDDEYSDPLEVAACAVARLSTPEKPSTSRKRIRFL